MNDTLNLKRPIHLSTMNLSALTFDAFLARLPLVAILRGIKPDEIEPIGDVIVAEQFEIIEVPLNSPEPLLSIERLARRFPNTLIGAGTVMTAAAVKNVALAGGRLILMPHSDPRVIEAAKRHGLICVPGVATPTEAFAAIANGADALKLFPAEAIPPLVLKAWRAIVPSSIKVMPVGGITPASLAPYMAAGANAFGLGSALYKPGNSPIDVKHQAQIFRKAFEDILRQLSLSSEHQINS